jgi:cytosine deaminase
MNYEQLLQVALAEARQGLAEGGIPVGACLADATGKVLGRGHRRGRGRTEAPVPGRRYSRP